MNQEEPEIRYWIDANDELVYVNEAWTRFALQNRGDMLSGGRILGRSLWEFISDPATCNIYRSLVGKVRAGSTARFTLRCDSPTRRRLLKMTITNLGKGIIEFATSLVGLRVRDTTVTEGNSPTTLNSCAWCSRLQTADGQWVDLEAAAEQLKLFHVEELPRLTHGICPACLESMQATVGALQPPGANSPSR